MHIGANRRTPEREHPQSRTDVEEGIAMTIFGGAWHGLDEAFFMFWETLWALVLGFGLSGAVQAFVSRGEMRKALGNHRPATLGKASFFGVISSSCSYASSALAKSLFARGADFTASMVFMIASTNLVVELGIVPWLLIGWQFALAEFVGGAIMIVLLGLVLPRLIPEAWISEARDRLNANEAATGSEAATDPHAGHGQIQDDGEPHEAEPLRQRLRSRRGWGDASGYTISDLTMLRKELVIGFVVAGYLAALVPTGFWRSLFLTGHGFWSSLENVILGPFLAIISFVCSVGNVPLAAALWQGGISFGGVVSFVFADLITLPLLSIYRKYFGTQITLRILVIFWATMSSAGLAVEYLFKLARIPEPSRPTMIIRTGFQWNYTTILNLLALAVFAVIYWLYRHRDTTDSRYAKDPVCGMQVETADAPASRQTHDGPVYFCSDHCAHRYDSDPARRPASAQPSPDDGNFRQGGL
ncbi:MAG: permease [Jatrophihabitans sp.]